ncbi:MAG: hypothetical protein K2Y32_08580 [Candidatus Obscuribacterales bacterium]|nr:hypothetical protein [Candidatus Obscuribacterales bacterium]
MKPTNLLSKASVLLAAAALLAATASLLASPLCAALPAVSSPDVGEMKVEAGNEAPPPNFGVLSERFLSDFSRSLKCSVKLEKEGIPAQKQERADDPNKTGQSTAAGSSSQSNNQSNNQSGANLSSSEGLGSGGSSIVRYEVKLASSPRPISLVLYQNQDRQIAAVRLRTKFADKDKLTGPLLVVKKLLDKHADDRKVLASFIESAHQENANFGMADFENSNLVVKYTGWFDKKHDYAIVDFCKPPSSDSTIK